MQKRRPARGASRDQPGYPKGFELPFKEFEVLRRRRRTARVEGGSVAKEGEWAERVRGGSRKIEGVRGGSKCLEGISGDFEGSRRLSKAIEGSRRASGSVWWLVGCSPYSMNTRYIWQKASCVVELLKCGKVGLALTNLVSNWN